MMTRFGESYVKYVAHGLALDQIADSPEFAFAVRTRIETVPSETKEATVIVTSKIRTGMVTEMSLPSCPLAESKSSDSAGHGVWPK